MEITQEMIENRKKFLDGLRQNPWEFGFITVDLVSDDNTNQRCSLGLATAVFSLEPNESAYVILENLLGCEAEDVWIINDKLQDGDEEGYKKVAAELEGLWFHQS